MRWLLLLCVLPGMAFAQAIQDRALVVGSEEDYPPFALGKSDGAAGGFTVELWKAVAAQTGLKYAIRIRPFRQLLEEFKAGKIDVLINLAQSDERRKFADFSVPHVIVNGAIFVRRSDAAIRSEADLPGKSIIVINGDLAHDYAISKGWEKRLVPVDTAADGLMRLASGKNDAMLISKLVGMQTLRDFNVKDVRALDVKAGFSQKFSLAVREGDKELLAAINEGLALTKANGTYDSLHEKWFGLLESQEIAVRFFKKYLGPVAAAMLVLGGFLMVRKRERSKVELRLRESEERLRLAITGANQGIYDLNVQTGECIVSPEYARMLGYDPAAFRETHAAWLERLHPDERERVFQVYDDYMAGRRPDYRVEFRQRTRSGEWKWILSLGSLRARSADGRPLRMLGTHTDISARKQAEEALEESERRFRTLTSHAPVGILMSDVGGDCLFVNERWCDFAGMKPETAAGKGWLAALHPEDRDRVSVAWRVAAAGGKDFAADFRMRTPEGLITTVQGTGTALRNEEGEVRGYMGTVTDLTARIQAEARSATERTVLERLAAGAPLTEVLTCLTQGYERLFSGMACSILMVDAEGRHAQHEAAPGLPAESGKAVDGSEGGPPAGACDTAAPRPEMTAAGDPQWTSSSELALRHGLRACWSVPVISSQGNLLATLAIHCREPRPATEEKITALDRAAHFASLAIERHHLIHSLQESQLRLETLVGNLPGMACRCANDAHWTMTYVSDGCEAITGYRRSELENHRHVAYADLVHPEDREWLWARRQKSLEDRTQCQNEYRILDKDGRERWVSERGSGTYDEEGRLVCVDGFIQDITASRQSAIEREHLDRKMQETQKLESLGVLAGGIAHDFNNILTAILGNASLALNDVSPGSPVRECLDQISSSSLRAADLCKQMLAYSGRGRFVVRQTDLGQIISETIQMLQISISKKATVRFSPQPGLPAVEADTTQIRQVIMNLVINASEAIGENGGVITLTTGLCHIDRAYMGGLVMAPELPEGDYVYLEVSDDGCGMSAETKVKIFDPFFTTKFTGRGLGLAAVLGIVRGHKGAMKVYSEPGRGTTFKVLLPAASGPADPVPVVAGEAARWQGHGTVLVVDDEDIMRSLVTRMLQVMGMDSVVAVDGAEAVEIFRADPARFALVLLDLTMPRMDGEQTFGELRRLRADVPVILMSGFSKQEALSRFAGKRLAGFLQKPFAFEPLKAAMREVLG